MTEILKSAVERGASDIFVVAGLPLTYKVRGEQQLQLTGNYVHRLVAADSGSGWLMREKRVNLLQCAQALPAIQLFI